MAKRKRASRESSSRNKTLDDFDPPGPAPSRPSGAINTFSLETKMAKTSKTSKTSRKRAAPAKSTKNTQSAQTTKRRKVAQPPILTTNDEKDSAKYKNLSHRNHILKLSDSYIGTSHLSELENVFVAMPSPDEKPQYRLQSRTIQAVPGLQKIFDEILNNAFDNVARTRVYAKKDKTVALCKTIKVTINPEQKSISVYNDGDGIPIVLKVPEGEDGKPSKEPPIYVPEMVFGRLLTSSNYEEEEKKTWGGRNGYGSKLCSIYSTKFIVETGDHRRKLKFKQTWKDNMSPPKKPPLVKPHTAKPFTKVTFWPDLVRFGLTEFTDDIMQWMYRRVIDIAGCTPKDVGVYLNNRKVPCKGFAHYVALFVPDLKVYYDQPHPNWEIAVTHSPEHSFRQVSLVNGIFTGLGGKHVDYVSNQIARKLTAALNGKRGSSGTFRTSHVKNNMWVFVNCLIPDPTFDTQTKERLTSAYKDFDARFDISDKFIDKLAKSEVAQQAQTLNQAAEDAKGSKTDGRKVSTIRGIPKLDDANWAGTKKSEQCILILTEGDSAKAMALSGLSVVGRDKFGVYPLRGKVLNVRQAKTGAHENKEIQNVKQILGLQQGMVYMNLKPLRYGRVLIMTDQDPDGSHIRGLLLNLFGTYWPSLLELGYVHVHYTPAVKIKKGKKVVKNFYSVVDYQRWKATQSAAQLKKFFIKHYKGLGTSTREEARDYFRNLHMARYIYDENAQQSLELAFGEDTDARKLWLQNMEWEDVLDYSMEDVPVTDFVNKELIHYSNEDNVRSLPSFCDGLKEVQRKVIYTVMENNYVKDIKVFVLGGAVTMKAAYHHGDASVAGTILGLAQNFVGCSNINLLHPEGQFGSRYAGGADAAKPRYINTFMEPVLPRLILKTDRALLRYQQDDGKPIEPRWFLPAIPLVLVIGPKGIGTGYSTSFPQYNPRDIVRNLRALMAHQPQDPLTPWYRKFKGNITPVDEKQHGKWYTEGLYTQCAPDTLEITELPVSQWTTKYEDFLDKMIKDPKPRKPQLLRYTKANDHDDENVHLFLQFVRDPAFVNMVKDSEQVKKYLKLKESKNCSTTNMHAFSPMGRIVRFKSAEDVVEAFYKFRLPFYAKRREYQIKYWQRDLRVVESRIRFVEGVIADEVKIRRRSNPQVLKELRDVHKFPPNPAKVPIQFELPSLEASELTIQPHIHNPSVVDEVKDNEDNVVVDDEDKEENKEDTKEDGEDGDDSLVPYHYLTKMPMDSITQTRLAKLHEEAEQIREKVRFFETHTAEDLWERDLQAIEEEI